MNPRSHILLWLTATAAMAALTSWIVSHRPDPSGASATAGAGQPPRGPAPADLSLHEWMHRRLILSPAQHAALEPLEAAYETERSRLREEIGQLSRQLAAAMRDSAPEAGILSIQRRLNAAQGSLQEATLRHFIGMRSHLDPRQAREFALWTHDSLLLSPAP